MTPRERVLVVENEDGAGPEMFERWFSAAGVDLELWRPYLGEAVPKARWLGAVMVLGGEMGACEDHRAPWLGQVRAMLAEATVNGQAVLGICLGAQMLAVACGGRVKPIAPGGEIGLGRIELTAEARSDRLFGPIASPAEAVQWHNDEVVQMPEGAVLSPRAWPVGFRLSALETVPGVCSSTRRSQARSSEPGPRRSARNNLRAEISCWQ